MFVKIKGNREVNYRPVAYIKDGKDDGQFIYLNPIASTTYNYDSDVDHDDSEEEEIKTKKKEKSKVKTKKKKLDLLKEHHKKKKKETSVDVFNNLKLEGKSHFLLFPLLDTRCNIALFGSSGSGKSFTASQYVKLYKKIFPSNHFYLVSELDHDDCLDKYEPIRVPISKQLITHQVEWDKLEPGIFMFDDIDNIHDPKLRSATYNLRKECLNKGRHFGIHTISTNHALKSGNETRDIIRESHAVFFFPSYNDKSKIKKFLAEECGISKDYIKKIMSCNSRWICVWRHAPMFCLTENEIFSLC